MAGPTVAGKLGVGQHRDRTPRKAERTATTPAMLAGHAQISALDADPERTVVGMFDDGLSDDAPGYSWRGPRAELLTLALLEDVVAVLDQHGFPPLRGYVLAELTASLYRLQPPYS